MISQWRHNFLNQRARRAVVDSTSAVRRDDLEGDAITNASACNEIVEVSVKTMKAVEIAAVHLIEDCCTKWYSRLSEPAPTSRFWNILSHVTPFCGRSDEPRRRSPVA